MHEVEEAREQRHATRLVRSSHGHRHMRLHRVNAEKHLEVEKRENEVEGGAGGGRQLRARAEPADDGGHAEEVSGVGQEAVVEVDRGLVLEDVAPCRYDVPHVRRHEGVAHERPVGEADAGAVARDESTWKRRTPKVRQENDTRHEAPYR